MAQFPSDIRHEIAVTRLNATGKQTYSAVIGAPVSGAVQPLSDRSHALIGGELSNPHIMRVDWASDIAVGDKVTITGKDATTTIFYVQKLSKHDYGQLRHIRCILSTDAPNSLGV